MNSRFATLVEQELVRARVKHTALNSLHEGFAVILEELEEFKAEVFKKREQRCAVNVLKELVQTAAMCHRLAEDCVIPMDLWDVVDDLVEPTPLDLPIDADEKGGAS